MSAAMRTRDETVAEAMVAETSFFEVEFFVCTESTVQGDLGSARSISTNSPDARRNCVRAT